MIVQTCPFGGPDHEFPDDWEFGGRSGNHPGADPRARATTYVYFDDKLLPLEVTQVPQCDDEAIDMFTHVAGIGKDFNPRWIQAHRPDGTVSMLPVWYDKTTDTAYDKE